MPGSDGNLTKIDLSCGHRGCLRPPHLSALTVPTSITVVRLIASTALLLVAARDRSQVFAFLGLAVYWVGDVTDGLVARVTHRETRPGAVIDILSDRLACAMFYVVFASLNPSMLVPIGVYLVEFMVLDCYLSLAFLEWPLISPNYFDLVDRRIYALNWTPLAKSVNTSALLFIMLATRSAAIATVWMLGVTAVKLYSVVRLHRLPRRRQPLCAAVVAHEDVIEVAESPARARSPVAAPALVVPQ